jgi:hypothetical protein
MLGLKHPPVSTLPPAAFGVRSEAMYVGFEAAAGGIRSLRKYVIVIVNPGT